MLRIASLLDPILPTSGLAKGDAVPLGSPYEEGFWPTVKNSFLENFDNNLILCIYTDRGAEYCGRVESYSYQLYLAMEDIDHSRTKANHSQTNGICKHFHKTMKNEFYDITFRKKIYTSLEQLQLDVDHWIAKYNEQRPHSGKYCYGKTPM